MAAKKYPFYMYHKDFDEPLRVDNKDEERQLSEKGYIDHYIHKEFPKYYKGKIYKTKKDYDAAVAMFPDVTKGEPVEEETVTKGRRKY